MKRQHPAGVTFWRTCRQHHLLRRNPNGNPLVVPARAQEGLLKTPNH
jgi:hypothetical protein